MSNGINNQPSKGDGTYYTDPVATKQEEILNAQRYNTSILEEEGIDESIRQALIEERMKDIGAWFDENSEEWSQLQEFNECDEEIEDSKEIEEAMKESQQTISAPVYEYLVRGAMLKCTCGSHCRRLNLPESHNYYKEGRPLMNREDSIPGSKEICEGSSNEKNRINIPYFGVCSSNKTEEEVIFLKKDIECDPYGNVMPEKERNIWTTDSNKNVKGPKCNPLIMSTWLCADENCMIDGCPAIREDSFLVCAYGGIIEVINSGQQYADNIENEQVT